MTKRWFTSLTNVRPVYATSSGVESGMSQASRRNALNKKIDQVVKEGMAPPLKAAGYRKSKLVFRRSVSAALTHIVEVQTRRWVEPDEASFSIECGVYPTGYIAYFDGPEPRAPRTPHGPLRTRIGTLTNNDYEKFWEFRLSAKAEELSAIAADIRWRIEGPVLDWLSQFPTVKAVADYLVVAEPGPGRTRASYWDPPQIRNSDDAAICYALSGDYEKARYWARLPDRRKNSADATDRRTRTGDPLERFIESRKKPDAG